MLGTLTTIHLKSSIRGWHRFGGQKQIKMVAGPCNHYTRKRPAISLRSRGFVFRRKSRPNNFNRLVP